jgi:hypothetical protein
MLILLFALIATQPASAKSPAPQRAASTPAKKEQLERLATICVKNSYTEGKDQGAACECLRANYERKFSVAELELLARIQTGQASKEEIAGKDELFEFDMLASHHCLEDSAWRWQPESASTETSGENAKSRANPAAKPKAKTKPSPKPKKKN